MKKTERHLLIQQMIRNEKLSTQKEIQDRLEAKGIAVTQTTLSRDLRDLGRSNRLPSLSQPMYLS